MLVSSSNYQRIMNYDSHLINYWQKALQQVIKLLQNLLKIMLCNVHCASMSFMDELLACSKIYFIYVLP